MTTDESDAAKQIINTLRAMVDMGIICPEIRDWHRMPFFFYCDGTTQDSEPSESYTIDQNGYAVDALKGGDDDGRPTPEVSA